MLAGVALAFVLFVYKYGRRGAVKAVRRGVGRHARRDFAEHFHTLGGS